MPYRNINRNTLTATLHEALQLQFSSVFLKNDSLVSTSTAHSCGLDLAL